jgi:hypothetical protein
MPRIKNDLKCLKLRKRAGEIKLRWIVMALLCLAGGLVNPFGVYAQDYPATKKLVVVGSGTVRGGNLSVARERAIKECLVAAVARVAADMVEEESFVVNFQQLNNLLFDQTDSYIQDFKVLTEITAGENHRVLVEATVAVKKMADQLSAAGVLQAKTTLPTVLFLISEQTPLDIAPRYWWGSSMTGFKAASASAMADAFRTKNFPMTDTSVVKRAMLNEFDKAYLTDQEAVKFARMLNADVVVFGKATARQAPNVMGTEVRSYQGSLSVRALRTDSGKEIAAADRNTVAAQMDELAGSKEALSDAGALAGDELAAQIAAVWRAEGSRPASVEVLVEGTENLAHFVALRKALNEAPGVQGVRVKEMRRDQATLSVDYQGKAEDLAAALIVKTFDSFRVNIEEISSYYLKVKITPQ